MNTKLLTPSKQKVIPLFVCELSAFLTLFRQFKQKTPAILSLLLIFIVFQGLTVQAQSYQWKNAPIGGGGFVTGIVTHPTSGDRYCRTDVGGAYRWDATNNKWVQLMDWLGDSQSDLYGVEALALDPQNANNVYMLCGTNYVGTGKSAILKSTDKGNTFTYTDLTATFKVHGNGNGRGNGERLAVDPKNSNILYCGTRANGLWKSTDAGVTWNLAWNGVTITANGNGICFVLFDPSSSVVNGASQTIYVGVSRTGGATLYRSTNGGASFTDISPTTSFMPHRAAIQGTTMYVTYANGEGPNLGEGSGKVYKLNTSTGAWTNVTPVHSKDYPYGGVSIDPTNVNRVIVSTCGMYWNNQFGTGWGDFVFLTTDGGANWTLKISNTSTYDANGMGWSSGGAINWMDCIEFDQANLNRVRVIGGGGVFTCPDITATNTSWKYDVVGIEETAFLDGVSIPGGPFISSFGDVSGFVHEPLTSVPSAKLNPVGGYNNNSIAYAAGNPNKVVRIANEGNVVYYSNDKGSTWTAASSNMGAAGRVAVSADGGTIIHCPSGSSTTYYSTNNGTSWSSCSGVSLGDAAPAADQVNSNYIYIFHPSTGQMFRSTNKGISFSVAGTPGASTANHPWESVLIRTVPGFEGHVWVPLGNNGLKYSTNAGAAYTTVANVSYCKSIGIGKAISGSNYPTIFLWGTISGVTGLFRSTDQGATWSRINNNSTQFAGAPFLVGDMNVAGRVFMSAGGGRGVIYWETSGSCTPTAITPYMQVGGTWSQTNSATVASGATVILGPQPTSGGSWSWSGMASGTSREVTLTPTSSGTATATYTNASGCQSTQVFTITVSGGSSFVTIANRATGLLIDGMGRTSAGSTCGQWASSGSWNQMWTLETSGAYVYIKNRNTGLYIDGRGVTANGSYAGLWASSTSNNLQWQQETVGSYVKFKNRATGLYLDGLGNSTNGSDLSQWANSTSNNQQWTVTVVTSGSRLSATEEVSVEKNDGNASLSPNPFTTGIKVSIRDPKLVKSIRMFDLSGKQVEEIEHENVKTEQTMGALLNTGLYVIQINGLISRQSFKVIKK